MAFLSEIQGWFQEAKRQKCTHLIVACDTFDYEDYPVYCKTPKECLDRFDELNGPNMQKVMEVYSIAAGWTSQSGRQRVLNLPDR